MARGRLGMVIGVRREDCVRVRGRGPASEKLAQLTGDEGVVRRSGGDGEGGCRHPPETQPFELLQSHQAPTYRGCSAPESDDVGAQTGAGTFLPVPGVPDLGTPSPRCCGRRYLVASRPLPHDVIRAHTQATAGGFRGSH